MCRGYGSYDFLNTHSDSSIKTPQIEGTAMCSAPQNLFDLQIEPYLSDTSVDLLLSRLWGKIG